MSETDQDKTKKSLTLSSKTLGLKKPSERGSPRASTGQSKPVTVHVKKKRVISRGSGSQSSNAGAGTQTTSSGLTKEQLTERMQTLKGAMKVNAEKAEKVSSETFIKKKDENVEATKEEVVETEVAVEAKATPEEPKVEPQLAPGEPIVEKSLEAKKSKAKVYSSYGPSKEEESSKSNARPEQKRTPPRSDERRRSGRLTISQALQQTGEEDVVKARSLASIRRLQEKKRLKSAGEVTEQKKLVREVIIPETIMVSELANRLATRGTDVIKVLMKMDVMVTMSQIIDADTSELVVEEFGHKSKRVSESDIELGLKIEDDDTSKMKQRAPVVTIMGHVDHGKTSLLDAIRKTNVVSGESGGITQHIGAYQIEVPSGGKITFIDTPGHAAFTEMRARGANVTDIVILVVAADDGVKDQTIEAIRHARAAEVPIILAINKIDKPEANPDRVRNMLLEHELVCESMGGDIQDIEVSAVTGQGLDKLEEGILLQAEILELKANPDRSADGVIVESKLEKGRGSVATVLVQKGTLKVGDLFVAGSQFGKVRALLNDQGKNITEAGPSVPVEVIGFNGTPLAGDDFIVSDNEAKTREVAEYRQRKDRDRKTAVSVKTMDQIFSNIEAGEVQELPVIIKSDVQGSMEAISGSLNKLSTDEVKVNILHAAVGGITESDIALANASQAVVIGFNVRANAQAREMAQRDGIEIRYYSIIYDVIDDIKDAMSGLLSPLVREEYIGNAEIRQVFNVSKIGKIAGCMVTVGQVKRGAGVRLLRDDVVIHEGKLKTLKRFKDEVKEVKEGFECGMAFENYNDIKEGDVIECYEVIEESRSL